MPLADKKQTPDRKYSVFIEDQDQGTGISGIKFSNRLVPVNFRKQSRGLGSASFRVLRSTELNESFTQELRTLYGRKVWICDTSLMSDPKSLDSPDCILWYGTIKSTTIDILEQSSDYIGYISAEEIGYYLATQSVKRSKRLPPFNPFLENEARWMANKVKDESSFLEYPTKTLKVGTDPLQWSKDDQDYVWSRADVIEYLVNEFNGIGVTFPDALDAQYFNKQRKAELDVINKDFANGVIDEANKNYRTDITNSRYDSEIKGNKDKYEYLYSKKNPISFDSYENKSLNDILGSLLESPFDWVYDYNTSFELNVVIYNKSTIDLPGVCPAAQATSYQLPKASVTNFNIVKDASEIYDRVTLRGNRILWCGGLTCWDTSIYNTLEKDWNPLHEQVYIEGKANSDGTSTNSYETDVAKASAFRQIVPKVYSHYKFKRNTDVPSCWVQVSKNQGNITTSNGGEEFRAFFGNVSAFTLDNNGNPQVIQKPIINLNPSSHKTPYKYADNWNATLPFKELNADVYDTDAQPFKQRFVIAKILDADGNQIFVEITRDNGVADPAQLNIYTDGVIVNNQIREVAAQVADEYWKISRSGPVYNSPPVVGDWDKAVSQRNPASNASYKGFTHWGTYEVVLSGYSDQYLEATIIRKNANGNKEKIIEDPNYEMWIIHPNTPRGLENKKDSDPDIWSNRVARWGKVDKNGNIIDEPIVIRNDSFELLRALYAYSNWLFQERRAAKIDYALMLYEEGLSIGQVFKNIIDGSTTWTVNSSIESIEWDISNPDAPRVYVSTSFPEIPQIKRAETVRISPSLPQPGGLSDSRSPVIEKNNFQSGKVKNSEDLPPPRTLGIGGGDTGLNCWVIVRGQEMLPSGYYGIKKLAALPADVPTWFEEPIGELLSHNTYPDGTGLMRNIITGDYQLVVNVSGLSFLNGDAPRGSVYGVSVGNFEQIKVEGTGTNPQTNPERFVSFASIIYGR